MQADRPKKDAPKVASVADDAGELQAYLPEGTGIRAFQQLELGRRGAKPRPYQREIRADGRVEGSLIGRVEFPLRQYLDPHSRGAARSKLAWPAARAKKLDAFFIEFQPALMEWPAQGREGELVEAHSQLTAFESDGVPFANGVVRRTMRMAGHESIRLGEQNFEDAVRMEAESELNFGWLATIRVHETAWFASEVGLVRREERFNGRALWLFRFHGESKYELADEVVPRVEMVSDVAEPRGKSAGKTNNENTSSNGHIEGPGTSSDLWSHIAICFERTGRRIQVSGVAIEWAVEPPAAN